MKSTQNTFINLLGKRFPEIRNIHVEFLGNIAPVIYEDHAGRCRNNYPPIMHWVVNNIKYSYVPKPIFEIIECGSWPFKYKTTTVRYADEELLKCIAWSVEGKTEEEINNLLSVEVMGYKEGEKCK